mmetsp:Transcript_10560/g.31302  ORF Transcript_10560/g.31302 Transcript_10560/m.31302 type:complete len:238 (+) Transcript_10560:782-1495(+)
MALAASALSSSLAWETRSSRADDACSRPVCGAPEDGDEGGDGVAPANARKRWSCVTHVMMRSVARSAAAFNFSNVLVPWLAALALAVASSARRRSASARSRSASARARSSASNFSAASCERRASSISAWSLARRSRRNAMSRAFSRRSSSSAMSLGSGPSAFTSWTFLAQPKEAATSQAADWNSSSISRDPSFELRMAWSMRTSTFGPPTFWTTRLIVTAGSSWSAKLLPPSCIWRM